MEKHFGSLYAAWVARGLELDSGKRARCRVPMVWARGVFLCVRGGGESVGRNVSGAIVLAR